MRQKNKTVLTITVATLAVLLAAALTVYLLTRINSDTERPPQETPAQTEDIPREPVSLEGQAESAKAGESESLGDTAAAIEQHKSALEKYKRDGDAAGASAAQLQLDYLEEVLKQEQEQGI